MFVVLFLSPGFCVKVVLTKICQRGEIVSSMVLGLTIILLKHGSANIVQDIITFASIVITIPLLCVFNQMSRHLGLV